MAASDAGIWKLRWETAVAEGAGYLLAAIVCLASELLIWGLSRTLATARLEFFSTIVGMALVFALSTACWVVWKRRMDDFYRRWLKARVDFINAHLGAGFAIPMIMLDQDEMLNGGEIGRVIGSFIATNIVSWVAVFLLSVATIGGVTKLTSQSPPKQGSVSSEKGIAPSSSDDGSSSAEFEDDAQAQQATGSQDGLLLATSRILDTEKQLESTAPVQGLSNTSEQAETSCTYVDESSTWSFFSRHFPILLSLALIFTVGIPLTITMHEERLFDGFTLWFMWISSVRAQRAFKHSQICTFSAPLKRGLATLMNPVLLTTLLMTGYTRAKASVLGPGGLARTLQRFSGGTPLYALWTAAVSGNQVPSNPTSWFGAGDAALSILECGILVWGFKLSECRRQIFSLTGLFAILLCTAAAAANVFLSVLASRAMGLHITEALSFAARSTTLALAKPATEAIGGNSPVNAMLVVSNGILGQLVYPFILDKLGVSKGDNEDDRDDETGIAESQQTVTTNASMFIEAPSSSNSHSSSTSTTDSPVTVAAGIAIGINGAAMGVSYLYETRSRAAPYAALSMVVFGVMTVVFTTVEPFKGTLISLASR
ncbi:hypothetical protein BBK36DRAFT_1168835 [Trichoderma citrinoviride]|uniref:LrgB-like protein n=1 Tax=Trichoderma citrinoviride TaxID=58853 RepID=A0A2T4BA61_9HYPO|nr:hypothetical protein BBK36DRAFT_1168835 [Trichoderma citrinoviride]PTB66215.1 hypothetical protein BBK36DRAFT_1168835 [Trichoderma citrinoviride]